MYSYTWDTETGGLLLNSSPLQFSKEPRPVYSKELDILGFDRYWEYDRDDSMPIMWAEANNYIYRGRLVAKTKGGTFYKQPQVIIIDDPEPNNSKLKFVDLQSMIEKNKTIMEGLVSDTIKKVYNTYLDFRSKVDIFHVSYSGGKDSEVTLDIVSRAIPHNQFVVVFGNTGMEFPDTYDSVKKAKERCKHEEIAFYEASSRFNPHESWKMFGPPSNTIRWCCSVHKTAPQLLLLRDITGKSNFKEMAFVGVRADESLRRSGYSYVSLGTKHKGQYSCNPILEWNSAEVYLYIYMFRLPLNDAYIKGNSRAGCLVCPMSADKSDYMRAKCYGEGVSKFLSIINSMSAKGLETEEDNKRYIESGGWKLRNNGREIKCPPERYREQKTPEGIELQITNPNFNWREWIKTTGKVIEVDSTNYKVEKGDCSISFHIEYNSNSKYVVTIPDVWDAKSIALIKMIKQAFRKSTYCILCRECEADCPQGFISMTNGTLKISDSCIHCGNCHKPDTGCLLYKSINLPKANSTMKSKSIDCYGDHAPKLEWIKSFFMLKDRFLEENTLGSMMISMFKRFLRDSGLFEENKFSHFAEKIDELGLENPTSWAIMLVNLASNPEFNWYLLHIEPYKSYTRSQLVEMLKEDGVKERGAKSITGAFKRFLALPFGSLVGLGSSYDKGRETYYMREQWGQPTPEVILYSLYKFAEACGDYKQFTLNRLMDDSIDSDGVTPSQIFAIEKDNLKKILSGLAANHPDFINVAFTLDLDNITLKEDKTSQDVLELI